MLHSTYDEAVIAYRTTKEYSQSIDNVKKMFFWEIGKYDITICAEFGKKKEKFCFSMSVDEENHKKLYENVEESLVAPLKKEYKVPWNFQSVVVEIVPTN